MFLGFFADRLAAEELVRLSLHSFQPFVIFSPVSLFEAPMPLIQKEIFKDPFSLH